MPVMLGCAPLLPLLRRYLDEWPEVQLEVSFSDRLTNLVEEASISQSASTCRLPIGA
jgi:DNA-binding transcriptional LysR family regulator